MTTRQRSRSLRAGRAGPIAPTSVALRPGLSSATAIDPSLSIVRSFVAALSLPMALLAVIIFLSLPLLVHAVEGAASAVIDAAMHTDTVLDLIVISCLLLAADTLALESAFRYYVAQKFIVPMLTDGRRSASRQSHLHTRSTDWFDRCVPLLSPYDFIRTFRVSRAIYARICADARATGNFDVRPCNASKQSSVELLVAMFLYKLGRTESYYTLAQKFGVTEGHAISAMERVERFMIGKYYVTQIESRWPDTPQKCAAAAAAMQARYSHDDSRHQMKGCVGALDGTLIVIWCPNRFQEIFYGRKGFYGINMQATVDAATYFTWIGGGRPASVWDGNAIKGEVLVDKLLPNLPDGYYISCDSGYRGSSWMLCPFKRVRNGGDLTDAQSRFNYVHALLRGIIEKAFGILKARFRWMLKGTQYTEPATYVRHFYCAAILHNMMLDEKLSMSAVELAAQPGNFDVEGEDDARESNVLEQYKAWHRNKPAEMAKLQEYYDAEMNKQRELQLAEAARPMHARPSRGRSRGAGAASDDDGHDIPDDAADSADSPVQIKDTSSGAALRKKVFTEMGLDAYQPTAAQKAADAARRAKRASRQAQVDATGRFH
jgi:DDE superfamily endonuclease